jgi:PAS domain S-box-containing protein
VAETGDLHKYDKTGSLSAGESDDAQNQIRAELAKERDFTAAVLQASGAIVIVMDQQGRVVRSNRACEQVIGYSEAELTGRIFWDVLISAEGRAASRGRFEALISTRRPAAFENEWINKAGESRRISFSNTVLLGEDGSVEYVVTTGIDITERHQAEQKLLKSEAQFRSIWEASRHPMALTDQSGTLLKVNQAFSVMV